MTASTKAIQKTAEAASYLVGNEITEVTMVSSKSTGENPKKSMATYVNETSLQPKGKPKERCNQKDNNKLLMNFDNYNYKCIAREYSIRKKHKFAEQNYGQPSKLRTKNWVANE